jgi:hypothetical protein
LSGWDNNSCIASGVRYGIDVFCAFFIVDYQFKVSKVLPLCHIKIGEVKREPYYKVKKYFHFIVGLIIVRL